MTKTELGKNIYQIAHLIGSFKLRSGKTSNEYFDKYRFEAQPEILKAIAQHMAELIPPDIDYLAALEMGGIPIGTALSLHTGIPCLFVRKAAKEYGTCRLAEGLDIEQKRLCVVEDVITTGGQVVESTQDLRVAGAIIENVLCVIYRGESSNHQEARLTEIGLKQNSLFTMQELKDIASK